MAHALVAGHSQGKDEADKCAPDDIARPGIALAVSLVPPPAMTADLIGRVKRTMAAHARGVCPSCQDPYKGKEIATHSDGRDWYHCKCGKLLYFFGGLENPLRN